MRLLFTLLPALCKQRMISFSMPSNAWIFSSGLCAMLPSPWVSIKRNRWTGEFYLYMRRVIICVRCVMMEAKNCFRCSSSSIRVAVWTKVFLYHLSKSQQNSLVTAGKIENFRIFIFRKCILLVVLTLRLLLANLFRSQWGKGSGINYIFRLACETFDENGEKWA